MAFDLGSILGSTLGDTFAKIVGVFKADPTVVIEKKAELEKIQLELQGKLQDALTSEIQAASANIRADATSGDRFTQRARPSFMYIVEVILVCNYILFPLLSRPPLDLPEPLFWLFGSAILGYTGARSWEKYAGQNSK